MRKIVSILGTIVLLSTVLIASEVKQHKQKHWDYSHNGPAHWDEFSKTCGTGHAQSPINIVPGKSVSMNHQYDLHLNEDIHTTAKVIDNGHSIKVTPKTGGKLELNGEVFNLLQFHFHGKSENRIDGKQFAMEMHLVHQNAKGELAVVGVMVEEGAHNKYLEGIVDHLDGGDLNIATNDILPKDKTHYYHFMGSLTTPPCSENVSWYIMKDTISLDAKQLAAFRSHHRDNFRPIQATNARPIEYK